MLSRTAENLFWMARYAERAETTARLLEVGARNAMIPGIGGGYRNEWDSVLAATGTGAAFAAKYGEAVQRNVETHLFFDRDNPVSIAACLTAARENGRIVRTALTSQMWDALNGAYQDLLSMARTERSRLPLVDLVDWTLRTTALLRGTSETTHLRNDGYQFLNLGYLVERADNTARLMDVKYYVLLPRPDLVGSGLDNYQWSTLLRALSADRAFNWAYGGEVSASKIADFLILNRMCPRALVTCVEGACDALDNLARAYGRAGPPQTRARALLDELDEAQVDDVFDEGLHEFLTRMIGEIAALSSAIADTYLSGETR